MNRAFYFLLLWLIPMRPAAAQSTFHGDAARTGVFPSEGPRQLKGLKWSFKAGGPVLSSPAVADGVVYFASIDGHVYAVDQSTGKEKWNYRSSHSISSSPAVAGGLVYLTGYNGVLMAFSAADGKLKWYFAAEYEKRFEAKGLHGMPPESQTIPDSWDVFTSSPAVHNGRVYFGSGDGNVYAVDALTGVLKWKFTTKDVIHASPSIAGGTLFIGSWDSNLYALDLETGQEKWRFKSGEDPVAHNQIGFQSSPAVRDGTVYVGCRDAHVYALDAATGRKKWDYPTSKSWVIGTPAVRDGVVYVGTSDTGRFHAIDATTGAVRWTFDAGAYVFSSAALAGDLAYVGDTNGKLYALETKTGKLAWEFQTEAAKKDPLKALTPAGAFSHSMEGVFYDYQEMILDIYRMYSVGGILSSPAVDHGVVYFGSSDGNLYALE